ncbi:hypothetical protein VPHD349_0187 [Vibrio phage D349]
MNMIRALRLLRRDTKPKTAPKPTKHELFGTYIVVTPEHRSEQLIAIQDWLKEHPTLTFLDMPYADVMAKALRNKKTYVCIDETGVVTASIHPRHHWRELSPVLGLKVAHYKVKPITTTVLGKEYNSDELEKALASLTPVEK